MTSIGKEGLKRAKVAIGSKDFVKVKLECSRILQFESDNYTALIYLGLALQNLAELEACEVSLNKAKSLQPEGVLAYQGLMKLYEHESFGLERWVEVVEKLRSLYFESGKYDKALELTLKLMEKYSLSLTTQRKYREELENLRPPSIYYQHFCNLENFPKPEHTLLKLLELTSKVDEKNILEEVELRRRRLSEDSMETIKKKVVTEVLLNSKYLSYLEEILNLRDQLEFTQLINCGEKYLLFLKRVLDSSLANNKLEYFNKLSTTLDQFINSKLVSNWILTIKLEFTDVYDSTGYDVQFLTQYRQAISKVDDSLSQYLELVLSGEAGFVPTNENWDAFAVGLLKEDWLLFKLNVLLTYYFQRNQLNLAYRCSKLLQTKIKSLFAHPNPLNRLEVGLQLVQASCLLQFGIKYYPDAQQLFTKLVQQEPNNCRILQGYCQLLFNQKSFEEGQKVCQHALTLQPEDANWLSNLAWAQFQLHFNPLAKANLERALHLDAQNALSHYRMGRLLWDTQDSEQADKSKAYPSFLKAAQLDPKLALPYLYLAYYYHQIQQDATRTLKCLLKYLSLDRTCLEVYQLLVTLVSADSDYDQLERYLLLAATHCPESPWVWLRLGYLHLHQNKLEEARQSFQTCVRKSVGDARAWSGLGQTYLLQGRFKAGLGAFHRSLHLNSTDNFRTQYYLALIYLKLEDHRNGLDLLDALLAYPPEDRVLKGAVLRLAVEGALDYAKSLVAEGRFGRAVHYVGTAITHCVEGIQSDPKLVGWYELLGDGLSLAFRCRRNLDLLPLPSLQAAVEFISEKCKLAGLPSFLELDLSIQLLTQAELDSNQLQQLVLSGAAATYKFTLHLATHPEFKANLAFKLSVVYDLLGNHFAPFQATSVQLAKLGLNWQPESQAHWIQLAQRVQLYDLKLSQHLYLTAIQLHSSDPVAWTNYGYLASQAHDFHLATQLFAKAKQLDPTYLPAWLGSLLVQVRTGPEQLTVQPLEHTLLINEHQSLTVLKLYASFHFLHHARLHQPIPEPQFSTGLDAIQKFCEVVPDDVAAHNLLGLYLEQKSCFQLAHQSFEHAVQTTVQLQQTYPERIELLDQFVQLQVNLARSSLQGRRFDQALQALHTATECVHQLQAKVEPMVTVQLYLLSALAHLFHSETESAIQQFEQGLTALEGDAQWNLVLRNCLAKSLWQLNTAESRRMAKDQLLACVGEGTKPKELLLSLLAMASVTMDSHLFQAVESELIQPNTSPDHLDTFKVNRILAFGYLSFADPTKAKGKLKGNVVKFPYLGDTYSDLFQVTDSNEGKLLLLERALDHYHYHPQPAQQLAQVLQQLDQLGTSGSIKDLDKGGWTKLGMKARFLCPWMEP